MQLPHVALVALLLSLGLLAPRTEGFRVRTKPRSTRSAPNDTISENTTDAIASKADIVSDLTSDTTSEAIASADDNVSDDALAELRSGEDLGALRAALEHLHARRSQNDSAAESRARALVSEYGISSGDAYALAEMASVEDFSDLRDSLEGTLGRKGEQWRVPASETGAGFDGPYEKITQCREELKHLFPTSLWRSRAAPPFKMEAVLDIPADLEPTYCSQPHMVNVYYPRGGSGPFPLISYAHGKNNGGEKLDPTERVRLFQPLAEEGFFVIAYQHGGTGGYCSENLNQLGQIEWLKNSSYASMIDFSKIGVMGHSMGGKATWRSTTAGNTDIKVAVTINAHCVSDCPVPAVPTLMISGNRDSVSRQGQQLSRFVNMTVPGVFAGLAMGHGFNDEWSRLALQPLISTMFHCHLLEDQAACSEINQRSPLEETCFGSIQWTEQSAVSGPAGS